MNSLLIFIVFVGIVLFIYHTSKPNPNSLELQPILDDIDPMIMSKVNNGKLPIRMWPGQTHIWNIFEGCIKKAKKDRWIYFCKVRKISLIEENPNISENELLPLISSEWKNMSNDDKNEYYKYI